VLEVKCQKMRGVRWVSRMKAYTINKGEHEVVNMHAVEAYRGSGCIVALVLNMSIRLS
jgi:hypothetical protein